MAHITTGVEYGLHCLLYLADPLDQHRTASTRDLADLQGVPVEYVAKLFTKLQKAGLVVAAEGARGGFRLAREPRSISALDVVVAIDGNKVANTMDLSVILNRKRPGDTVNVTVYRAGKKVDIPVKLGERTENQRQQ